MSWRRVKWLGICIGGIGLALGVRGQGAERPPFWYSVEGRVPLTEVRDYVTLRFVEGTTEAEARDVVGREDDFAPFEEGWWIPSRGLLAARLKTPQTPEAMTALREHLLSQPEVERVFPVYSMQEPHIVLLTDDFCVQFKPEVTPAEREALNARYGARVVKTMGFGPGAYVLRVTDPEASALEVANAYQESGQVLFAHPDFIVKKQALFTPNDPIYPGQWHLNSTGQGGALFTADVNAPEAWDITRGDRGITIAVYDDAVQLDHEDFQAANKIAPSWDFWGRDPDPGPDVFYEAHGTSVAGVATAVHNNALGVSGIAPECKLMGLKWGLSLSDDAAAFTWVKDNGGDVMNNSWSYVGLTSLPAAVRGAVDNLAKNGRGGLGALIFVAAGNSAIPVSIDNVLAAYKNTIAVSASTDQDRAAYYTSFGPEINLCAPSNGGVTSGITTTDLMGSDGYSLGNYTNDFGGTSSASPLACGVGALVLSANPSLTAEEALTILQRTAIKIDPAGGNYDEDGHSDLYGFGKVDAFAAVQEAVRWNRTPKFMVLSIENDAPLTETADVNVTLTGEFLDNTARVRFLARPGPFDPEDPEEWPKDDDPGWSAPFDEPEEWTPYRETMRVTLAIPQEDGQPAEGITTLFVQARNEVGRGIELPYDDIFFNLPPKAVGAVSPDETRITVFFDQPVDRTTAEQVENYTVTPAEGGPAIPVKSAVVTAGDTKVVRLITETRPLGDYQVQIHNVQDTNQAVIQPPYDVVPITTRWIQPQPGFPKVTDDFVFGAPTLADLTGDGIPELLMASQGGKVYAWAHSAFGEPDQPVLGPLLLDLPGWPQAVGSSLQASPVVGDIDQDGEPEIIVGASDRRLWAWNVDGSRVDADGNGLADWPVTLEAATGASPSLGDVDYDGQLEIIVGDRNGNLYAFDGDGSLLPGWPVRLGGPIASTAAVGDLDGQPGEEIVVGANDGVVYALKGEGTPLPGWDGTQNTGGSLAFISPVLVDRNGDQRLDTVVIGSRTGQIFSWDAAGQPAVSFDFTPAGAYSSPAVFDLEGDRSPELVFGTDTDKVYVFNSQGGLLYEKTVGGTTLRGSPVVADIGYDALGLTGPEILVGAADGCLYGWNAGQGLLAADNPEVQPDVPGLGSSGVKLQTVAQAMLAVGDLDGDGRGEVVAGADRGYAWDLGPNSVGPADWPMFGQSQRHSGWRGAPVAPRDTVPPRLAKAESGKGTEVLARFSERLDPASAEQVENYTITFLEDETERLLLLPISAAELMSDGRTVQLTTSDQTQDTVYTLQAQGIQDLAGNGAGTVSTTEFTGKDTLAPLLIRVEGVDFTHVDVVFSENMDPSTALALNNYTITPELTVQEVEFFDPDHPEAPQAQNRVRMTTAAQAGGVQYRLRVDPSLTDLAGNPLAGVTSLTFEGVEGLPPQLKAVKTERSQFIYVLFDEPVEKTSAETPANYTIKPPSGSGKPELEAVTAERGDSLGLQAADMAALGFPDDDPRQLVKVTTTPSQDRDVRYTVTVEGVRDLFNNVIRGNNTLQFIGVDTVPPRVISAASPDVEHVDVTFNEEVDAASAENPEHYKIELHPGPGPGLDVLAAVLLADGKTVRLTTSEQTEGAIYQVTVSDVTDTAPVPNVIQPGPGDTVLFGAPSRNPVLISATQEDERQALLQFNKELEPTSAETLANYTLETLQPIPQEVPLESVELLADGRQVRLTAVDPFRESVLYRVTVVKVTDKQGNPVQTGNNTADLRVASSPPQVVSADRQDHIRVLVTFNEVLDRASAEGPGNYVFTPSLTVRQATLQADGKTVLLVTDPQQENTVYQIRVRNVLDAVGNPIERGQGDVVSFVAPGFPPRLIGVRGWGSHPTGDLDDRHVELDFSEPLQKLGAEDVTNYTIRHTGTQESLEVQKATLSSDGQRVQLLTSRQAEDASYHVRVRRVLDLAGNEIDDQQNTGSFSTPRVLPAPPSNLQVVASEGRIVVSWSRSQDPDVVGYLVYRADAATGPFLQITATPVSSEGPPRYEDTTGVPAVKYWYKVAAVDGGPEPIQWRQTGAVAAMFPDDEAPQIAHQQPAGAFLLQALTLTATVTDNGEVAQVVLFYRTIGQEDFRSVEMARQPGTDDYTAIIPGKFVTGNGVEYFLQARDTAEPPNVRNNPPQEGRGPEFFVVHIFARLSGRVQDPLSNGIPGVTIKARRSGEMMEQTTTDEQGNYTLIQLPPGEYEIEIEKAGYLMTHRNVTLSSGEEVTSQDITAIQAPTVDRPLALLGVPLDFDAPPLPENVIGNATFLMSTWDPEGRRYVTYPHQSVRVQRGRGYFLNTLAGTPEVVAEALVPDPEQPVTVPVEAGWNLIGNPFPLALTLTSVRVKLPGQSNAQAVDFAVAAQRGWIKDFLWGYGPEGYFLVGDFAEVGGTFLLEPWSGYWLRAYRQVVLVIYSVRPSPLELNPAVPSRTEGSPDGTVAIRLVATAAGISDAFNVVGMAGSRRPEGLRIPSPPPVSPFVDLSILDPQGRAQAVDLRPPGQTEWTYDLVVDTDLAGEEVALTWPDLTVLPQGYTASLTDLTSRQVRSLRTTTHYTFTAPRDGSPRRFRLTIRRSSGSGLTVSGFSVMPHRAEGTVTLTYTLSAPAEVTLTVRTLTGQVVATLVHRAAQTSGLNQVVWDGRDEYGRRVPPGTYLCELVGVPETGEMVQVVRTMGN